MSKFRKKPVVIEAVQWTGSNYPAVKDFVGIDVQVIHHMVHESLSIPTLEGTMCATKGDYIIRGVKGEIYPCKPDIFAATYEPADAAPVPDKEWRCDTCGAPLEQMIGCRVESCKAVKTRMKLLAREPTKEMRDAARHPKTQAIHSWPEMWRLMWDSAPNAPVHAREWISVGERLPEYPPHTNRTERVFACLADGYRVVAYMDAGHRFICDGDVLNSVTHWMPLPPPPPADAKAADSKQRTP